MKYLKLLLLSLAFFQISFFHLSGSHSSFIHVAAYRDDAKSLNSLIEQGVDIDSVDHINFTPLFYSVLPESPAERSYIALKILLKNGADSSVRNRVGATAFHLACGYGILKPVEMFLNNDCVDPSYETNNGETPLFWALTSSNFNLEVIHILLINGATINPINIDDKIIYEDSYDFVSRIMSVVDSDGSTILHLAADYGCFNLVKFLLDCDCANCDCANSMKNNHNKTACDYAIESGHRKIAKLLILNERWTELDKIPGGCLLL